MVRGVRSPVRPIGLPPRYIAAGHRTCRHFMCLRLRLVLASPKALYRGYHCGLCRRDGELIDTDVIPLGGADVVDEGRADVEPFPPAGVGVDLQLQRAGLLARRGLVVDDREVVDRRRARRRSRRPDR